VETAADACAWFEAIDFLGCNEASDDLLISS
jgi:hypothetical protein